MRPRWLVGGLAACSAATPPSAPTAPSVPSLPPPWPPEQAPLPPPPWPPGLAPGPPPALPPWPPGLAPRPPPPVECTASGSAYDVSQTIQFYGLVLPASGIVFLQFVVASGARPVRTHLLPWAIVLLFAAFVALTVWRHVEWAECANDLENDVVISLLILFFWGTSLGWGLRSLRTYRERLDALEGDLPARLRDGSLRLLRVKWLLARPSDWVLQRRQDLPEDAFWRPTEAVELLKKGKVAALSYRWLGRTQNDPERFHLNAVLKYYSEGIAGCWRRHQRPAIMIDFASIPQVELSTVTEQNPWGERTRQDQATFDAAFEVMSNMYASPRVLVLMHMRLPDNLEQELAQYGGDPPEDRVGLLKPYAGKHCRSGWCTSELALTLMLTEGGGHAYELGVGPVPVGSSWERPTFEEMRALFWHPSTKFGTDSDREKVSRGYLELRKKVDELEAQRNCTVTVADSIMTREEAGVEDCFRRVRLFLLASVSLLALAAFLPAYLVVGGVGLEVGLSLSAIIVVLVWGFILGFGVLPSRILRAHLAAALCCRPRDRLPHSFHWSLREPPFRLRDPTLPQNGSTTELVIPACPPVEKARLAAAKRSRCEKLRGVPHAGLPPAVQAAEAGLPQKGRRSAEGAKLLNCKKIFVPPGRQRC